LLNRERDMPLPVRLLSLRADVRSSFVARHAGWTIEADLESLPDVATLQDAGAGPVDGGYWARLRRG